MEAANILKIQEFDMGLPSMEELMPLTQPLIPPKLALALAINPAPCETTIDLNKAVQESYSRLCHREDHILEPPLRLFPSSDCSKPKLKRVESNGSEDGGEDNGLGRAVKRPRLVWTPQLHKRFVDVIDHLGMDKAVPKTIMEMMNVEGLTRENVASHLQKYRLYLKRMEGLSNGTHSNSNSNSNSTSNSNMRRVPSLMDCDGFGSSSMLAQQPHHQQQYLHSDPLSLMPMPTMLGSPSRPYGLGHLGVGVPARNSVSPATSYLVLDSGALNGCWNRH